MKTEQIDKKSISLNVMVVGDNIAEQYLENIYASTPTILPPPKTECKKKFTFKQDETLKWTYEVFHNGLSENDCKEIYKRITEHDSKNNVIVCFILNGIQNAKNIINEFNGKPEVNIPFIIFIVQDKSISLKSIKEYIDENEDIDFDFRNLRLINYDGYSRIDVISYLWEFCCYYNELGQCLKFPDLKTLIYEKVPIQHCLNFFLIGKPGMGKSTLINVLNGKKLARESIGKPVTTEVTQYFIKDFPISIFDCPGFATTKEDSPESLKEKITKFYSDFKKTRDNIHGIFFLMKADTRNYDDGEKEFIKFILDLEKERKINIFFLINFCTSDKKKTIKKFISQLKYDLQNDFKDVYESLKFEERIFPINIINTSEDEKGNCCGLDKFFGYLYKQYKSEEISNIEKLNLKELIDFINKNELYRGKTNKEKLIESIKSKCYIEIASFATVAAVIGAIPIPFCDILPLYTLQASLIIAIAITFGVEIDKNEALTHVKSFVVSGGVAGAACLLGKGVAYLLKCIPGVGTIVGGIINASVASSTTVGIGKSAVELYSSQMTDKNLAQIIIDIVNSYNKAINGFNSLREEYENKDKYT